MPKLIRISLELRSFGSKSGNYQTRIVTYGLPSKTMRRIRKHCVSEGVTDTFHETFRPNVRRTTKRYEWENTTFVDAMAKEEFMKRMVSHLERVG